MVDNKNTWDSVFSFQSEMPDVITFKPLYKQRVWGGRELERLYGRDLPCGNSAIGESWEVVDRKNDQSVVESGEFVGKTIHELWCDYHEQVFGQGLPTSHRFPLLLKILDARKRLSVQVHPPADIARDMGGEPKTEMWYVAHADPGAEIFVGIREGVTKEIFEIGANEGKTKEHVHRVQVEAGDFMFIPSGRVHAIGGGVVIFEIQENSDTTYRVYDWGRNGLDGVPRALHVQESLKCIDFTDIEPESGAAEGEVLVHCPQFQVTRWELTVGEPRVVGGDGKFALIALVSGEIRCGERNFCAGDFFLVPADLEAKLITSAEALLLHVTLND